VNVVKSTNNLRKPNNNKLIKENNVDIDPQLSPEKEVKIASNTLKINTNNTNIANSKVEFANPELVKIDLNITENMAKMILDHKKNYFEDYHRMKIININKELISTQAIRIINTIPDLTTIDWDENHQLFKLKMTETAIEGSMMMQNNSQLNYSCSRFVLNNTHFKDASTLKSSTNQPTALQDTDWPRISFKIIQDIESNYANGVMDVYRADFEKILKPRGVKLGQRSKDYALLVSLVDGFYKN